MVAPLGPGLAAARRGLRRRIEGREALREPAAAAAEPPLHVRGPLIRAEHAYLVAHGVHVGHDQNVREARAIRARRNDARAHLAPGTQKFRQVARSEGLKAALKTRDQNFGDGRARVRGPEIRDEKGYLVPE